MTRLPRTWREIAFHHAVHEAAHAVVAWIMTRENNAQEEDRRYQQEEPGFRKVFVRSIEASRTAPGHEVGAVVRVEAYDPFGRYVPGDAMLPQSIQKRSHRRMEREVMIALAGPLAEARYRKKSFVVMASTDSGCQSDMAFIRRCAADFSQSDPEREAIIDGFVPRTRALLRMPRVWPTIIGFAHVLCDHRELSGEQALSAILEYWGAKAVED